MKKLFLLSIMFLATVTFATAQQGQGQRQQMTPEERAKAQTERLETLLKLTAAQKTKVQAIELEYAKETSALRQNNQGGDREAMREALQKLSTKRDTKYKEVLTADQFKKYQEDNEQRQRERGQGGQGGGQRPRNN